jgi:pimeloyl-ACP methyl ester carboxylesterase
MKIRAGVVSVGLADHVLNPLVTAGKRVHLVGHSFGGRLMTSATASRWQDQQSKRARRSFLT